MFRLLVISSLIISSTAIVGCQSLRMQSQNKHVIPNNANFDTTEIVAQHSADSNSEQIIKYNNWQWHFYNTVAKNRLPSISVNNDRIQSNKNGLNTVKANSDDINNAHNFIMSEPTPAPQATQINSNTVWGYSYQSNTVHPQNWKDMKGNHQCGSGEMQSPINIKKALIPSNKVNEAYGLKYLYNKQDFDVVNDGYTVTFIPTNLSGSKLAISGKVYNLIQLNFHANSEHSIMNTHYPVELQIIHKSLDGAMVNMSVFVNVGETNPFVQALIDSLPKSDSTINHLSEDRSYKQLVGFNVSSLISKGSFYAYKGSSTIPPCAENVQWLINAKPINASSIQLSKLKSFYNGNNRPIQPLANREVHLIH